MREPKRIPGWVLVAGVLLFVGAVGAVILLGTKR
jgi:hypothetical protein